jgi:uncharacterized protein DUF2795
MATAIWAFVGHVTERQLDGFEVRASDGSIGTIDKATYDVGASYIVVDTGPWIFAKRVLLPAGVIQRVERDAGVVHVGRSREEIRSAPEFEGGSVTAAYRDRLGRHYSGHETGTRKVSGRSGGAKQRESRGRSDADERRRDELYEDAKRLGIKGRSKMNKRELARAVARAEGAGASTGSKGRKANPIEVQKFLDGVRYPTRRGDLLREAKSSGASAEVRSTLERLPDKRYGAPTDVSEAIGELSPRA